MRPQTLRELWAWAYREGREAALPPPARLHARYPYPESDADLPERLRDIRRRLVQRLRPAAIVGPPFSRAFARYLDGGRAMTPIRRALLDMVSRRPRSRTIGEHAAWAAVEGGHEDPADVRAILGCSWRAFREEASSALAYLWDKTQAEIALEPKRVPVERTAERHLTARRRKRTNRRGDRANLMAPQAGPRRRLRPGRESLAK